MHTFRSKGINDHPGIFNFLAKGDTPAKNNGGNYSS
jgi:hypothetical protein